MYKPPIQITMEKSQALMESIDNSIAETIVSKAGPMIDIEFYKDELRKALLYDRDQYNIGKRETTREVYKIITSVKADILEEIKDSNGNIEGLKLALEAVNEIDDRIQDAIR